MKKILIVLLALACVFGAFAQDKPTVVSSMSAYLDGGVQYTTNPDAFYFYGNETPVVGGRMNFNYSFAYGDYGAKIRFRAQPFVRGTFANNSANGTGVGYADVFVRRAWAYYNLFDGMVQFNAGIFGIGDFGTSYVGAVALDNPNTGLYVKVMPVAGLTLGAFVPATADKTTLSTALNGSIVAAKYSMDKVMTVQGWVTSVGANPEIVADVNVSAIENLTLTAEFYYATGTSYSGVGPANGIYAGEQIAYAVGALTPGVWITENMPSGASGTTSVFTVNPFVSYDVTDTMHVGADLGYSTATNAGITFDAWAKADFGKNYLKLIGAYNTNTTGASGGSGGATITLAAVSSF